MSYKDIIFKILKIRYNATSEPQERSFLLPDGKFISLDKFEDDFERSSQYKPHYSMENWFGFFINDYLHTFDEYDYHWDSEEDQKQKEQEYGLTRDDFQEVYDNVDWDNFGYQNGFPLLMKLGCIRLNGGKEYFISIPGRDRDEYDRPTYNQYYALCDWIEKYGRLDELIDVNTDDKYSSYDWDSNSYSTDDPEYIINRIKRYYASGTLYEDYTPVENRPWDLKDIVYWYNTDNDTYNAIIDYKKKKTRVRTSLLVVKDNQVLLCKTGNEFSLPGGGIEPGETVVEAAKRETKEEVNIVAKNIKETGLDYCLFNDELEPWVIENVPEKYQWFNYYTCLCIGEYDKVYKGKVDEVDKDPEMKNSADWYNIESVVDNPAFLDSWKQALIKFGYYNNRLTEDLKDDAKDYFGTTYNWRFATYINTDGTLLDGSGEKLGNYKPTARAVDHREISHIFNGSISGDNAMLTYMNEGNIRWKPESPGFELIKEPTEKQYVVLAKLIRYFNDVYYVDISNNKGEIVWSKEYEQFESPIKDLKNYFNMTEDIYTPNKKNFLITGTLYHWSPNMLDGKLKPNYQGIHLAENIEVCKSLAENRGYSFEDGYLYRVEIDYNKLHPAYFDIDPMEWSGQQIAYLLINKINNNPVYGASSKLNDDGTNWQDEISTDVIQVENLSKKDLPILNIIYNNTNSIIAIKQIQRFLEVKGYNCIIYSDYGEDNNGSNCYTLFNNSPIISETLIKESLTEATRTQLISKSRNTDLYKHNERGKNRFERKKFSKVANQVKSYNNIDMNDFFKKDLLTIVIPVTGETDSYNVTLQFDGVVSEMARNIKSNQNKFEYRTVVQALSKIFNTGNIKVKCTCKDFCLHKDTEIKLLDGRVLTVEKLLEEFNVNKNLYLYSVNKDGDFAPGKINNVWISNYTSDMIKITLDNGREIITTPEHKYLLRTNEYKMAKDLVVGQSLMPLYFSKTENGYETVKSNSESGTKFYSTYKIVANTLLQKEIEEAKTRSSEDIIVIHHKDFDKNNNNPSNLYPMGFNEHYIYHYEHVKDSPAFEKFKAAGEEYRKLVMDHNSEEYKKQADVMKNAITNYYNNLTEEELYAEKDRRSAVTKNAWENGCFDTQKWKAAAKQRGIDMHTPEREALIGDGIQKKWDSMSVEERKKRVVNSTKVRLEKYTKEERSELARKGYYTICRKVLEYLIENNIELTEENYYKYKNIVNKKAPKIHTLFSSFNEAVSYFKLNHKIINIEYIHYNEPIPVYDIEVDTYNNFYVDAGVILHNCYRYQHQLILNNDNVDGTDKDPGPGKTGMANTQGKGCKHVLLALNNLSWIMQVSSCIKNYITYMDEHKHNLFLNVIFPKMYGVIADDAIENNLVPENTNLETDKHTIETINQWARNRGKIKPGTNKNPVTGTGGRTKKEVEPKPEETKETK